MPVFERTVRIGQCSGGVYPRLLLGTPSVIARPAKFLAYSSEQAPQSLRLPRSARNDNKSGVLAMTFGED